MRRLYAYDASDANESTRRLVEDGMSTGLTSTHTASGSFVLYHVFVRKQCILCLFKCSQNIAKKILNDAYADRFQWLSAIFIKTWKSSKVSEALNRLLKVLIIAINAQSHSVDAHPSPGWGGGDHLGPYGRKLIGSFVPVHSRSVRSNTYAFLDLSLKIVAFLPNYFTCFPIYNMIVLTVVLCYGWFMVLISRSYRVTLRDYRNN